MRSEDDSSLTFADRDAAPSIGHTPTPWRVDPHYPADIIGADGKDVAETTLAEGFRRPLSEQKANAAFIVNVVNCHHELLDVLKQISNHGSTYGIGFLIEDVRAAIAKAEGK